MPSLCQGHVVHQQAAENPHNLKERPMRDNVATMTVSHRNITLLLAMGLLGASTYLAYAQPPARNPPPCPSPDDYAQVVVTKASKNTRYGEETVAQLGDDLTLEVQNLAILLDKAKCTMPVKKVLLFLDGRPMKDVTPFPPTDPRKPSLIFPLKRTENSRDAWTYILGGSPWTPRPTAVSVGLEDEYAAESNASINLQVIPRTRSIPFLLIFAGILIAFAFYATKCDLLRDVGPQPEDKADKKLFKPYSLARTQAAFWFFVVLGSYFFIVVVTWDFTTTITGTVLTILGISAGTLVGSAIIDADKDSRPNNSAPTAQAAAGVVPGVTQGGGQAATPADAAVPGATQGGGQVATPADVATSENLVVDILSDANGLSFHRFQMLAWTVVLGLIFILQVYANLAMPTFSESLLALLGISAGTYLGLKIPEQTTPKQ
jgi:hypothetical protein